MWGLEEVVGMQNTLNFSKPSLLLLSSSKKIYLVGVHSQGAWIHMLDDIIIVTFGFEQVEV